MDTKRICTVCGKPLAPSAPEGLCPECLLKAGLGTGVDIGADTGKGPRFIPPKIEELAPKFPQLEILEFIGQGGMGAVYKARQKQLDRIVALKILPPQAASGPGFAERFTREARALARLNHPHIVTLYEFGQADGLFYFFMEFVDGVNLRQLLNASRIAPKEALAIVPQICEALQFAHDTGIVHRDIKPENILLDKKGQVKIADFGVAKITQGLEQSTLEPTAATSGDLTEAGSSLGTPQYMAPEQIKNSAEVDHRADIYSLGVVFYQMLTGELPSGKIEPPSKKVVIDVRLDEVVLRALEKKPELRFQQVSDVKTLVETIASTPGGRTASQIETAQTKNQSQPASPAPPYPYWPGYEYKSKRTWFGLPLLHVANGFDPDTGKVRHARGIVAIGGVATGVVAIGGRAHGIIAFGGLVVGVLAIGGLAAGVISFGGLAIALALSIGGVTIAPVAIGGLAVGYFAIGGQGFGAHVLDSSTRNLNDLRQFYSSKLSLVTWAFWTIWALLLGSSLFISSWARKQALAARGQRPTETRKTGARRLYRVLGAIIITLIVLFLLRTFVISSYRVETDSVAPEIPRGSHFLVWKLTSDFVPGDLVAYRNGDYVFIGRVIRAENDDLIVNKNGHPNTSISRGLVIGKVISIYWRGTEAATPAAVTPVLARPPFVAQLPQATVELAFVGDQPWTNPVCWYPNGQPSPTNFATGRFEPIYPSSMKKVLFYLIPKGTNDISMPICIAEDNSVGQVQGSFWGKPYEKHKGYFGVELVCPSNTMTVNLFIGVADGPWETVISMGNSADSIGGKGYVGEWTGRYDAVHGTNGDVAISCSYTTSSNCVSRMLYVNGGGDIVPIKETSSDYFGNPDTATLLISSNEYAHIKEFLVQRRKLQWAEFDNVSLQQGHLTQVTARDDGVSIPSAQVANWPTAPLRNEP